MSLIIFSILCWGRYSRLLVTAAAVNLRIDKTRAVGFLQTVKTFFS